MSVSYTVSDAVTFTVTHAKHMSAKVAADLKRIQRLYAPHGPTDKEIDDYEAEMIAYLKAGYLEKVSYGFQRNGTWIEPSLHYTAKDLAGGSADDDDPGRIQPGKNISGAVFTSYLTRTSAYFNLSQSDRDAFNAGLPIDRVGKPAPGISGYLVDDRTYSSGGRALARQTVRSL
jgi:hypothetical protein